MSATNCSPTNGAPVVLDSMDDYDVLPPVVRKALQDATGKYSAIETLALIRAGGVQYLLEQLAGNEILQHIGAVRAGLMPRTTGSFQVRPRTPTSPLEKARRERREKAAARIARRYR